MGKYTKFISLPVRQKSQISPSPYAAPAITAIAADKRETDPLVQKFGYKDPEEGCIWIIQAGKSDKKSRP